MITIDKVCKQYEGINTVAAVKAISINISAGELVALVGPSGSGKSTLLNMIGALDRPSSGDIKIDGEYIKDLSDDDLTRLRGKKIGFVFQFFNLLPTLTAIDNVSIPLFLQGWSRDAAENRASELLDLVKLSHRKEHIPDELSGGERQRVAIARALALDPPILLADEPTGNLDSSMSKEIAQLLRELNTKLGKTILIVTHNDELAESCHRIIRMRDGTIIEDSK